MASILSSNNLHTVADNSELHICVYHSSGSKIQLHIVSVSHHRLPWAFTTVSITVIDKVGNANRELYVLIISRQNLTSKMLVTWSDDDCTLCICPKAYALMLMQLISTAADGTSLVLHSVRTLLIWANLSKCYKDRITANYYLIALLKFLVVQYPITLNK